ncbi:MAG: ORF6N domain-containing protein, partial [Fibromonadales bacterium]|nr:ORF6N domain-containing protein [Fibromonadales bacterium]
MEQISKIESRIFTIRGLQVMLDRDLAELYQVPVKALNQAVKRNINRFPERFRFQLGKMETSELVTNCDRFKNLKHSSVLPCAFTESGVAMLSTILRSETAVSVCVKIMDAFVAMRKILSINTGFIQRLETVEIKQIETDKKVDAVLNALQNKDAI